MLCVGCWCCGEVLALVASCCLVVVGCWVLVFCLLRLSRVVCSRVLCRACNLLHVAVCCRCFYDFGGR